MKNQMLYRNNTMKEFNKQICDLKTEAVNDERAVSVYGALAHPVRLTILRQLAMENICCCKDIVNRLDLAQSTVSQHLKVLVLSGLISYKSEKQSSLYQINPESFALIHGHMQQLIDLCVLGSCHNEN